MGGATFGLALAQAGKRVLFCEKGVSGLDGSGLRGDYAETAHEPNAARTDVDAAMMRAGRCIDEVVDCSGTKPRRFVPYLGAGSGGSSALYGMALERFFPDDFNARAQHRAAVDSTLPERWPISYDELAPYYTMAERLYRVRGIGDPSRADRAHGYVEPSPAYSSAAQELAEVFEHAGLRPYHLPLACEYAPGCPGCQGYLCARQCKNESERICLAPATTRFGAVLLDRCEVHRLEASPHRVTAVVGSRNGREVRFKGKLIVLAAGALATPLLLLRSRSSRWPQGLANASGLVGRNLMRHFVDLYAVFPKARPVAGTNRKEIGVNDMYASPAGKLGSVQSFGAMVPAELLVGDIQRQLRDAAFPLAPLFGMVKPLVRFGLDRMFARAVVLATIAEDLPYRENRVFEQPEGGVAAIDYRISDYDRKRIAAFRHSMRRVLRSRPHLLMKQAENNERLAHVCGTCRFGDDPRDSVLDRNNKAHGLDNLYVLDASFFPSSGGTNPALTVAANALRVAERLNSTAEA